MTIPAIDARTAAAVAGFDTAVRMAEAAADRNPLWWSEIRSHADRDTQADYWSSVLLGALISESAHRNGIAAADVWDRIRAAGRLLD